MSPERTSAQDAALLRHEGPDHLHVGAVLRFGGPPPEPGAFRDHVRDRLARAPRYRQRAAWAAGPLARVTPPVWIDDPTFNLEYHVRHTALPAPGDADRLRRLTARIFSQALDRTKPLWELWVVEGLEDESWALIAKTHLALADGVTGVALLSTLLDPSPNAPVEPAPAPWQPRPVPSPAERTVAALGDAATRAASPRAALRLARGAVGALASALESPGPSPLRGPISPHRRMTDLTVPLEDFKAVKNALGATVNDVVLASVAGGLRHWLHERGRRTRGEHVTACVPLSTERDGRQHVVHALAPLPVTEDDPTARLAVVQGALASATERQRALGAGVIADEEGFNAPTLLAQASRVDLGGSAYDLLVTNIPGPTGPRYVLGRRLTSVVPVSLLAGERALTVACLSYAGRVEFGLLADYDALPDLEVLADGIRRALAELVAAAGTTSVQVAGTRAPDQKS